VLRGKERNNQKSSLNGGGETEVTQTTKRAAAREGKTITTGTHLSSVQRYAVDEDGTDWTIFGRKEGCEAWCGRLTVEH